VKILIIKPSSLGDVVHALRVAKQILTSLPSSHIDWVIKSELQPILTASGLVRNSFLFQRGRGFNHFLRLICKIRREKYDYVLDLQGLLRSACLLKFAHSKQKLGVADGREFSTFFYKSVGEKSRKAQTHAIDRLVPFLNELSIKEFDPFLSLDFPESKISKTLTERLEEKKFILLFPESRRREKAWPYFKELSLSLSKESSINIMVAGNKQDQEIPHALDLRGRIKLVELPDLISRADLVVSNDSAPLHIASALGKPLIALFGPTSARRYGPYPINLASSNVLSASDGRMSSIPVSDVELQIKNFIG